MVSIHKPVHSKITLTCLPGKADLKLTAVLPGEWLSRRGPFLAFAQVFAYCSRKKNCQNRLLLKNSNVYCRLWINYIRAWEHRRPAYAQLSPLYPSLYPYVTQFQALSRFPYWKRRKAGRGLGTRLAFYNNPTSCTVFITVS